MVYSSSIFISRWTINKVGGAEIPVELEEKLGGYLVKSFLKDHTELNNDTIESTVDTIFQVLTKMNKDSDYKYNIYIIETDEINALTLPGGNIVVFSGLLKLCNTPEEFASVLAHEIGHVEKKHLVKKLIRDFGTALLISSATGNNDAIAQIISKIISLKFDRETESEADEYAFELLEKCGIRPQAFADFMTLLDGEKDSNTDFELLRSHPENKSRIKAAKRFKLSSDFKEIKLDDVNWNLMKKGLD